MATLPAFSRRPDAANVTVTTTSRQTFWTYDPRVLGMLIVPFLATVAVIVGRMSVAGHDVVVGYNHPTIARKGPGFQAGIENIQAAPQETAEGESPPGDAEKGRMAVIDSHALRQ